MFIRWLNDKNYELLYNKKYLHVIGLFVVCFRNQLTDISEAFINSLG